MREQNGPGMSRERSTTFTSRRDNTGRELHQAPKKGQLQGGPERHKKTRPGNSERVSSISFQAKITFSFSFWLSSLISSWPFFSLPLKPSFWCGFFLRKKLYGPQKKEVNNNFDFFQNPIDASPIFHPSSS